MATLTLQNVRKNFGDVEVIRDVSIDVAEREFVVFVGPSGCGKSTLIRLIAGLEDISAGTLSINGVRMNDVGPAERGLAMVFQSYALYPHMTVRDNMSFALRLARVPLEERQRKVAEAARILHLESLLDRKPGQLSGGQRQRVAIGRAIVRTPRVFLFDEPLSNLDAALRAQMRVELARLHAELQATMIYVTHDQVEAMTMADRIVVLNAGRVEQIGSPLEIYRRPESLFVAGFVGSPRMNVLPGRIAAIADDALTVCVTGGQMISVPVAASHCAVGDAVSIGIRPEGLRPDSAGVIGGTAVLVEHLGPLSLLHVRVDEASTVIVQTDGKDVTRKSETVRMSVDSSCCHVFDSSGRALPRRDVLPDRRPLQ